MGLYTVVEPVDKPFLKDRFGQSGGLLLKPERAQGLPHLGDDWVAYNERYRPRKPPKDAEARRLIEFTRLIHKADDAEFRRRIAEFIDVQSFLRYAAVNCAITNLDSFFGTGHNYYLYLNPATEKFVFIPWDMDHSFGGFGMAGSPEQLMEWSIRKPYLGENRLVQRVLAMPGNETAFRDELQKLLAGPLRSETQLALVRETEAAIRPVLDEETKAQTGGMFGFGFGRFMPRPPEVSAFVMRRSTSIADQLAGKSQGQELSPARRSRPRTAAPQGAMTFAYRSHGGGCLVKKAFSPWRHSSVSRGAALAWAHSSTDSACRENRCSKSFVRLRASGPPSASIAHHVGRPGLQLIGGGRRR